MNDVVVNDGFMNIYTVASDFGDFTAYGTPMLAVRVHEIGALASLDELSKTEVFTKAVASGTLGQVETIVEFGKNPISTIKGIPSGISRMFKTYKRQAEEGLDDAKEFLSKDEDENIGDEDEAGSLVQEGVDKSSDLFKKYVGVSDAQRKWARKLKVDPYTSNETLQKALAQVAWVERTAKLSLKFVNIPDISGAHYVKDVNELAWGMDPYALKDLNQKRLKKTGADDDLITAFYENPWFFPSLQTRLIELLDRLDGVNGRRHIIERAIPAESEAQARFLIQSVAMMLWFHEHQGPLRAILEGCGVPFAVSADGDVVVFAAVDHLCWTEEIALLASMRVNELDPALKGDRTLWTLGTVSPMCSLQLGKIGWRVRENLRADMVRAVAPVADQDRKPSGYGQ